MVAAPTTPPSSADLVAGRPCQSSWHGAASHPCRGFSPWPCGAPPCRSAVSPTRLGKDTPMPGRARPAFADQAVSVTILIPGVFGVDAPPVRSVTCGVRFPARPEARVVPGTCRVTRLRGEARFRSGSRLRGRARLCGGARWWVRSSGRGRGGRRGGRAAALSGPDPETFPGGLLLHLPQAFGEPVIRCHGLPFRVSVPNEVLVDENTVGIPDIEKAQAVPVPRFPVGQRVRGGVHRQQLGRPINALNGNNG